MKDAREIIGRMIQEMRDSQKDGHVSATSYMFADDILSALAEAGYVVIKPDPDEAKRALEFNGKLKEMERLDSEFRAAQEKTNG